MYEARRTSISDPNVSNRALTISGFAWALPPGVAGAASPA